MRKVLVTEQEGLVLGLCDSILERESNGGGGTGTLGQSLCLSDGQAA